MKAARIKELVILSCLSIAAPAWADDLVSPPATTDRAEASPRFSLGTPAASGELAIRPSQSSPDPSLPPPSAFEWKALTANGPAAGSDPTVGAGSGKAYYDFKDGQPYPFYIYTRSRS